MRTLTTSIVAGLLLAPPAMAQRGAGCDLSWNTIDAGGIKIHGVPEGRP